MINVTDTIKQAYEKSTTQYDKIVLDNVEYVINNVDFDDDCYEEGNVFGTAIAKLLRFEIDSSVNLEGKEFKYYTGIKTISGIEWIKIGTFITQDVEPNDTIKVNTINAMDYMLKTNVQYVSNLEYSNNITLLQVAQEACNKAGIILATIDFPNKNFIVDSNQFEQGTLIRQVIQAIAQISGTVAKIKNDDKLYFITPKTTGQIKKVFKLNDYSEIEIKRTTNPINLVSLGMSDVEGENIVLKDEASIQQYGENSLIINDNPFAYTQSKRQQLITAIFNAVKGFEYKAYTMTAQSLPYLETLDNIQIEDFEGNIYNSFIFRLNNKSPKGLESTIEAPSIIRATINYQNIPSALEIAKRTELVVDKQKQQINALVTSNTELVNKTSQLEIAVDKIEAEIGEIADVTVTIEGYHELNATDINESEPILIKIYPTSEDITPLRPKIGLYPRIGLYPHKRELIFTRIDVESEPFSVEYNIPKDLYKFNNYYDEFVLDYTNQKCYIQHRIGIDENGDKYLLEIEETEYFDYPTIQLLDGSYTITMPAFENVYMYMRLMAKNIYTSQFATKVELNSKITQTASEINLSVDQKLSNYSTTQEMNSAIAITASEIDLSVKEKLKNYSTTQEMNSAIAITASGIQQEVNKKVGEDELGTKIQQNYESVQIAWNKISEFIQFINAELQILNNNKKKLMTLDKVGQHFYDNSGKQIGDIGLIESSSEKQISFAINGDNSGNSMVWGIKKTRNGTTTFFPIFRYGDYNTQIGTEYGGLFTLEAPILMQKNTIFLGTNTNTNSPQIFATEVAGNTGYVTIKTEKGFEIRNSSNYVIFSIDRGYFKLGELIESYLNVSGEYVSHFLGTVNIDNDLVCNGNAYLKNVPVSDDIYSISGMPDSFFSAYFNQGGSVFLYTTSSDKNLKCNIKNSEECAIDKIKKIKHRQFDWKSNKKHQENGYIAQEMEEIDKNFVHHNIVKDKEGKTKEDWQINVLNVLSTATKAIQEQQNIIEQLKEKIKEMEEKINGKN